jgi:hypothetical protein
MLKLLAHCFDDTQISYSTVFNVQKAQPAFDNVTDRQQMSQGSMPVVR